MKPTVVHDRVNNEKVNDCSKHRCINETYPCHGTIPGRLSCDNSKWILKFPEVLRMDSVPCPFCSPDKEDIVIENAFWYARWDEFPATRGHLLVIPFRHCTGIFDTTTEEQATLPAMLIGCKQILDGKFSPEGYNIVINCGEAADQRVMHCHVHIIPRYAGDNDNPPGGIRGFVFERPGRVV